MNDLFNTGITNQAHIKGIVSRIIFSKEDELFYIFSMLDAEKKLHTVKGSVQMLRAGDEVDVIGELEDTTYGKQVKANFIENLTCRADSSSKDGITAFLSSGIIKGLGKVIAERIVSKFGEATLEVIETFPARLAEVKGVTLKKANAIRDQVVEQLAIAHLMSKLGKYGISARMMSKISNHFHGEALAKIDENPYCLCEVEGIAFKLADKYAQAAGISKDSPHRLKEGVKYILQDAVMSGGSCGMTRANLIGLSGGMLEVASSLVSSALTLLCNEGEIIPEGDLCYDKRTWMTEESLAKHLVRLIKAKPRKVVNLERVVKDAEKKCGILLSLLQRKAVMQAIESNVSVITGQPGTGKTTIVQVLIAAIEALGEDRSRIMIAAPTGKAANRLSETCGDASTQHRLLGAEGPGKFRYSEDNPLDCATLIVDEMSMDDCFLANATVRALSSKTRLVLVGDVDQLPSVGPGQVLKDLIDSGCIPTTKLTEIRRQGEGSSIVVAAAAINAGKLPEVDPDKKDFIMIRSNNPREMMVKSVNRLLELGESADDIQVLCPMKNGEAGVHAMNAVLQPILNPLAGNGTTPVERFDAKYFVGDRVMQLKNDYDHYVFNGDIGKVIKADAEEGVVIVKFDAGDVSYTGTLLDQLTLSYASTVHKFQGSEARNVIIPVTMGHYSMLKRNLIYTGITRARNKMILVVEPHQGRDMAALQVAVSRTDTQGRISRLADLLRTKLNN